MKDRTRLGATALDLLILLLVAIAVVIGLSGGTRLHVGPVMLSLRGVWRVMIIAIALAGVRLAWVGRAPFAPAFASSAEDDDASDPVARLLGETRLPRAFYAAGALLVVICAVALRAQLRDVRAVPDLEDPVFSAWRIAWVAHQAASAPLHLFDANIFFPSRLAFTYSDSLLLPALVAAPAIWAGIDPIAVSNLLLIASLPLCALAFCWSAYRLTGDARAAFISGLAAALYPYHFEHYSHLELQMFFWIPLSVVFLARVLRGGRWRDGVLLGATVAGQALSAMYYGVMLAMYLIVAGLVMALAWRVRIDRGVARAAALAVLVAAVAAVVLGPPYLKSLPERGGGRKAEQTRGYSARPGEWLVASGRSMSWGTATPTVTHYPERELFPGGVTPSLALLGVAPPWSAPVAALLATTVATFDWSLGLNGATYELLYRWLLPFRSLRSPVRFAIFCGSSLMLLAAYGSRRVIRASPRPGLQVAVTGALALLVVADLRPRIALVAPWRSIPPIYASVHPEMVLAEFPMQLGHNIAYMYFSTRHWARLVNGYSGYVPEHYDRLEPLVQEYWTLPALERLHAEGATHLTVNCAFYDDRESCARDLTRLEGTGRVERIAAARWEGADVRLYSLRASPPK